MEIAAMALKMTGLDIHTARFQALSALTGTGFTTRETELIMRHRQRRAIIMGLMVVGPICFLGMFSSILISVSEQFQLNHVALLIAVGLVFLLVARSRRFIALFHRAIEKGLKRYRYPRRIQLEEILNLSGDYGVSELKVTPRSPFANKTLQETDIKEKGFVVLAIERGEGLLAVPKAGDMILPEDILVIFGQLKGMKALLHDGE